MNYFGEKIIPEHWTAALIHPKHRGDRRNSDNYREIVLLDCKYKVLLRTIYNKYKDQLQEEIIKEGFRLGGELSRSNYHLDKINNGYLSNETKTDDNHLCRLEKLQYR